MCVDISVVQDIRGVHHRLNHDRYYIDSLDSHIFAEVTVQGPAGTINKSILLISSLSLFWLSALNDTSHGDTDLPWEIKNKGTS